MIEKNGVISDIIFHNKDNGYTIAVFETEETEDSPAEQFTAVGSLPGARKGSSYVLRGDFKVHPKYGEQFAFRQWEEAMPVSEEGIVGFLSSGVLKGIGPKAARAIVSKFGAGTLKIIEENPKRLTEVSGIGEKKAAGIAESFRKHRELAEVTLMLQQYGIDAGHSVRLYKEYGKDTVDIIKNDPYRLVDDVAGFGFRRADAIAKKTGIAPDDESRVCCGIRYLMWKTAAEGNTFYPKKEFDEAAASMLEVSSEVIEDDLYAMSFSGDIKIEEIEGRAVIYLYPYYRAEQHVASCLIRLNHAEPKPVNTDIGSLIASTKKDLGIDYSPEQSEAIKAAMEHGVIVITGGPGTGKTTIINSIIKAFESGGLKTAVAAPTGRAAKRIEETTGHSAATIHRLLEYYYSEGEDEMRFGKNEEDQLDYDAVIVDEASMIDLMLMDGLVSAIRPGCRLIIVGDADQLPSVGAGNVLRDIIDSGCIYSICLETIFRQAGESLIVVNAHRINRGEYPQLNQRDKDFFMMRRDSVQMMKETIIQLCAERLPRHYEGLDPMHDIQVLTPVKKGPLGTIELNRALQAALNPSDSRLAEKRFGDRIFREGDKVMQTKNNYEMKWRKAGTPIEGEGVFNGDVGYIEDIDSEDGIMTVVFDEDKYVQYDASSLEELDPAYAVTVHKAQGSEFPVIIMPMSWFPPVLATRNLLYTAVTRGKKLVVLVGSERQMQKMIENNSIKARYSGLAKRLGAHI